MPKLWKTFNKTTMTQICNYNSFHLQTKQQLNAIAKLICRAWCGFRVRSEPEFVCNEMLSEA